MLDSRFRSLLLASLAGFLVGAPHLSPGLWVCPFVGLAILFACVEGSVDWRRALQCGVVAGLVNTTVMFYWLVYTMVVYGNLPVVVSLLGFVLYAVLFGTRLPVLVLLAWWLRRRSRVPPVLAGPLATLTADRLQVALFPMCVGSSQMGNLYFMQLADVVGAWGLTFVVALVAALAWQGVALRRWLSPPVLGLVVVLFLVYGYGIVRLAQVESLEAQASPVKVAVVQPNTPLRWERGDAGLPYRIIATCEQLTEQAARAAGGGLDLVVWPEGGTPFSFSAPRGAHDRVFRDTVLRLARSLQVNLVFYDLLFEGSRPYNNMWLVGRDGRTLGSYQKVMLLAFGEYIPGAEWFPSLEGVGGVVQHRRGASVHVLQADCGVIGPQICYEILFAGFTRDLVQRGARYIVNLTNDAWFGPTTASQTHLVVAYPRAIEARRPLVRCTNSGITTVISAGGRFLSPRTATFVPAWQVVEMRSPLVESFFVRHGEVFVWGGVLVTIACAAWPLARRRRDHAT